MRHKNTDFDYNYFTTPGGIWVDIIAVPLLFAFVMFLAWLVN